MTQQPFIQVNQFHLSKVPNGKEFAQEILRSAMKFSQDVEFSDIKWSLWEPINASPEEPFLFFEQYQNARRWGEAEDLGVTHPDIRGLIRDFVQSGGAIRNVQLWWQARSTLKKAGQFSSLIVYHSNLDNESIWNELEAQGCLKDSLGASLLQLRISGPWFDAKAVWIESERSPAPHFVPEESGEILLQNSYRRVET